MERLELEGRVAIIQASDEYAGDDGIEVNDKLLSEILLDTFKADGSVLYSQRNLEGEYRITIERIA